MKTVLHRLVDCTRSTLSGGPLIGRTPIGALFPSTTTSTGCGGRALHVRSPSEFRGKRWNREHSINVVGFRHIRFTTTLHDGPTVTAPKRSNAAGAVALLFGVSAIAIVGQTIASHFETAGEQAHNDGVGIGIDDHQDGKSLTNRCHALMNIDLTM